MLPSFIVIGAAKAGTTSMCDLLSAHPDVFVTTPKEPHYFSSITGFHERRTWYESLYEGAERHLARGEGSTSYTHPARVSFVAPRLREHVPECRLIYMVRHPVRRLESDWKMRTLEGRNTLPIGQAVDRSATLLTFGLYWQQLSVYRDLFPDDQIQVVFLEDLARDPEGELRRVYGHVGVDPSFVPPSPDEPRNSAEARARSKAISRIARRVPGLQRLAAILPDRFIEAGKQVVTRPVQVEAKVEWSRGELESVVDLLREDSRRLLEFCGKDPDFWDYRGPESQ